MKILRLAVAYVFLTSQVFALVSPNTAWEIRSTADSGNLNGCAFDNSYGGDDGTMQNGPVASMTDLAIDGADQTKVTSATHIFFSTEAGNALHITAGTGFTQNWFTIISVSAGAAFLYSSAGTAGSTNGTARVGGACSSPEDAVFEAGTPSSNTYWIKTGAYSPAAVSIATTTSINQPANIIGYNVTRGDLNSFSNAPTISMGASNFTMGQNWNIFNMNFTGTSASGLTVAAQGKGIYIKFLNSSASAGRNALSAGGSTKLFFGDFSSTNGNGVNFSNSGALLVGSYVHHSTTGFNIATTEARAIFNVFDTNASTAILAASANPGIQFWYNTVFCTATPTNGTGTGYFTSVAGNQSGNMSFVGNIFYGCKDAMNIKNQVPGAYNDYNDYFNNLTNFSTAAAFGGVGPHDMYVDPQFTDWIHGDFRIGTNLKGAGAPGAFGVTPSTGFLDIGAVQRQEQATSAGTRSYSFSQ